MKTINDIQKNLILFDNYARNASQQIDPETNIQAKWKTLFDNSMPIGSAKSFVKHYRDMRSKKQLQNGGGSMQYEPAPLKYDMVPGLNTAVYARLPVAVNSDPDSIRNLDVYFTNSITKGCGIENSSLSITEGMGSNKIGGSRKHRAPAKSTTRKTRNKHRKNTRRILSLRRKNTRRNQRGGYPSATMDTLTTRFPPSSSSVPPNIAQAATMSSSGSTTVLPSPSPSSYAFQYLNPDIRGLQNPGNITVISDNFPQLLNPAGLPWGQTTPQNQAYPPSTNEVGAMVVNAVLPKAIEAAGGTNEAALNYAKSALTAVVNQKPIPQPPDAFVQFARGSLDELNKMEINMNPK